MTVTHSYVKIPGGQVHYQAAGRGDPLLLLHQTSQSSEEYSEVLPILAKKFRAVAMDIPGHGGSFLPPDGFRIEDHAACVVQFLDALHVRKTSIVGHHVGSRIAVEVAATWPERVDRLVLSGCPWYSAEELKQLPNNPMYRGIEVTPDGSFLSGLWAMYRSRWKSDLKPDVLCKLVSIHMWALSRSFDIHEAASKHDIDPRLRIIKSPTLLVSASGDSFLNKLGIISKIVPGSRTQVIDGAGYFVALEKPAEFARVIQEFLLAPGA